MSTAPFIVWFRQDLRLSDNPALAEAARKGPVITLYILDDESAGEWKMGGAPRWWLHHSLGALNESLKGHLVISAAGCPRWPRRRMRLSIPPGKQV